MSHLFLPKLSAIILIIFFGTMLRAESVIDLCKNRNLELIENNDLWSLFQPDGSVTYEIMENENPLGRVYFYNNHRFEAREFSEYLDRSVDEIENHKTVSIGSFELTYGEREDLAATFFVFKDKEIRGEGYHINKSKVSDKTQGNSIVNLNYQRQFGVVRRMEVDYSQAISEICAIKYAYRFVILEDQNDN